MSEEDQNNFKEGCNYHSFSSKEEDTQQRRRKKTKIEYSIKQAKDANWPFKKHGPKYPGLKEIKASNGLCKKMLSYRLYRLKKTTRDRPSSETGEAKDFIKQIEMSFRRHYSNWKDPIEVLDFVDSIAREANI